MLVADGLVPILRDDIGRSVRFAQLNVCSCVELTHKYINTLHINTK